MAWVVFRLYHGVELVSGAGAAGSLWVHEEPCFAASQERFSEVKKTGAPALGGRGCMLGTNRTYVEDMTKAQT